MRKTLVWTTALLCLVLLVVPALAEITPSTADVTWSQVTGYTDGTPIPFEVEVGYIIRWGTSPGNYTELHDAGWDIINWRMTGLVPGTTYYVSVRAYTSRDEQGAFGPDTVYLHTGQPPKVPVHAFLNIKNGTYLYTANEDEKNYFIKEQFGTWKYQGIVFHVYEYQQPGTIPVYRFLNGKNWSYLYTADEFEKTNYINTLWKTWKFEGSKFHVPAIPQTGMVLVDRFVNIRLWSYKFTINPVEKNYFITYMSGTWKYEGQKFPVFPNP